MVDQLLDALVSGLSGVLVYGAIALVTLVGIIKCIYPVMRNSALLNRAIMKLERSAANNERPIWREARFLGRALRAEWQRFLLNAGQLDLRGMPCNTDEYINEDTVIYKPGHAQLAELIPSLLTSLGILGTFIGLMVGLTDLDLADAAKTIDSIPSLLSGMRFAFATSVAGISCSLVFNMVNRMAIGHAFKALDAFDEAFYELAMPRPLDPEVQLICQKQDDELNLKRTADQVGSQVAGALEMAVGRAMQPMTAALDQFMQTVTHEQIEGVQRIVTQFVAQMNHSMNGQFTALSDTLGMINQNQMAAQQNLQRTLAAVEILVEDTKRLQQGDQYAPDPAQMHRQEELLALLHDNVAQQAAVAQAMYNMQGDMRQTLVQLDAYAQQGGDGLHTQTLSDVLGRMNGAIDTLNARLGESTAKAGRFSGLTGGK